MHILKNPKLILLFSILIIVPFVALNLKKPNSQLLDAKTTENNQSPQPSIESSPSRIISPSIRPATPQPKLSKPSYTIAIFGDSMIDTMGEHLEYLEKSLKAKYPQTQFKLFNYGIGGQNVDQGLTRFNETFSYQTRNYPSIGKIAADVIVLGSFSYNPFLTHDKSHHNSSLLQLITLAKNTGAQVYLLAEIAPLANGFGKGPHGSNWPEDLSHTQALHITELLENVIDLSNTQNIPLINAYQESKVDSRFGNKVYVNPDDGIHPSVQGHVLTANLIARTIKFK